MASIELDKKNLSELFDLFTKGRMNLQPEYQRGRIWDDQRRYDLIDSVLHDWPMGLALLRAYPREELDKTMLEQYDVVDGQQRLTTLFEYFQGKASWIADVKPRLKKQGFVPYQQLSSGRQARVDEYKVAIAYLRDYEVPEIQDIYSRLQAGKPLKIGERIKALRSTFRPHLADLSEHELLKPFAWRHESWNLAAQFFKASYNNDPLERVEFTELSVFLLETAADASKATKARERAHKLMNYAARTLKEAVQQDRTFEELLKNGRLYKWLFAVLMNFESRYALAGRETAAARGLVSHWKAKSIPETQEWTDYLKTGRTGRMDTRDVKHCLNQLSTHILNATKAEPVDSRRFFSAAQRTAIFENWPIGLTQHDADLAFRRGSDARIPSPP